MRRSSGVCIIWILPFRYWIDAELSRLDIPFLDPMVLQSRQNGGGLLVVLGQRLRGGHVLGLNGEAQHEDIRRSFDPTYTCDAYRPLRVLDTHFGSRIVFHQLLFA